MVFLRSHSEFVARAECRSLESHPGLLLAWWLFLSCYPRLSVSFVL